MIKQEFRKKKVKIGTVKALFSVISPTFLGPEETNQNTLHFKRDV